MIKLLTIVVPVYKVEPYINKCLDSCLIYRKNEQGEKALDEGLMNLLEVIIVNDGTPDNSAEMSREYVKRFPNTFRQIDKENGGHGSAWNVGLKEATGKYLRFLDSDDWLTNLDRLMQDLMNCDADVVFSPFDTHYALENRVERTDSPVSPSGKSVLIGKDMWGKSNKGWNAFNFWSITYKTNILSPLYPLFAEKVMYDDYILTWAPLVNGRVCMSYDYVVYNYLVGRPGQSMSLTMQEKNANSYWACFMQYEKVRRRIDENKIPSDLLETIDRFIAGYAKYIMGHLVFLPYKESKSKMGYLWKTYVYGEDKSQLLNRYMKLPFGLFYVVEHLRYKKNNKKN